MWLRASRYSVIFVKGLIGRLCCELRANHKYDDAPLCLPLHICLHTFLLFKSRVCWHLQLYAVREIFDNELFLKTHHSVKCASTKYIETTIYNTIHKDSEICTLPTLPPLRLYLKCSAYMIRPSSDVFLMGENYLRESFTETHIWDMESINIFRTSDRITTSH